MPSRKRPFDPRALVHAQAASARSNRPEYLKPITGGYTVELDKLPLPTESYVADTAWVERDGGIVSLFFGKRHRDATGKLKTRLEIRFSQENFATIWKNSAEFAVRVNEFLARLSEASVPSESDATEWPAEKDHALTASLSYMTHSGSQAEVDLFEISASELHLFQTTGNSSRLTVKPVVRVYLSTYLMGKLLGQIRAIAEQVEPEVQRAKVKDAAK